LKVNKLNNPIPQNGKFLEQLDGYMPLLFNRTETNQQYFNLTLSANLDNVPILETSMENLPASPDRIAVIIKDGDAYKDYTDHPDTTRIFST